jgi:hypothetical protein
VGEAHHWQAVEDTSRETTPKASADAWAGQNREGNRLVEGDTGRETVKVDSREHRVVAVGDRRHCVGGEEDDWALGVELRCATPAMEVADSLHVVVEGHLVRSMILPSQAVVVEQMVVQVVNVEPVAVDQEDRAQAFHALPRLLHHSSSSNGTFGTDRMSTELRQDLCPASVALVGQQQQQAVHQSSCDPRTRWSCVCPRCAGSGRLRDLCWFQQR